MSLRLCLHRSKNLAYCRVGSKFHYFGTWGKLETEQRYRDFLAKRLAVESQRSQCESAAQSITVGALAQRWVAWMTAERGATNSKVSSARTVALDICREHAALPATRFGPRVLQQIQRRLLTDGLICRSGINRRIRDIVGIWKWGVSEELVSSDAWQSLSSIRPLRSGVGWNPPPRVAADPVDVQAVIEFLHGRGMAGAVRCIQFLRFTGCRPSEAYGATWGDMQLQSSPPLYVVRKHKCSGYGMDRVVVLNDHAVAAVASGMHLRSRPDDLVFCNRAGHAWEKTTLAHAIERSCAALGLKKWTPYQLRHLVATETVNRTGNEAAAAALLGHSPDSRMIRRYSRDRIALAMLAARAVGTSHGDCRACDVS